ncbi:tetratricopeptide repeat protein [bacterium]|nr:tetratricopeptide repeat protein [bacterium]
MRYLVPHFIAEHYSLQEMQGMFDGSALFLDISGFTHLTEVAFTLGEEGVELIGREIKNLFEAPVALIITRSGFISHFAGDAFLAIFPGDQGELAVSTAHEILTHFDKHGRRETKHGVFEFSAKCGVAAGTIRWGITRNHRGKSSWYFLGEPIVGATKAEASADRGALICASGVRTVSPHALPPVQNRVMDDPVNDDQTLRSFIQDEVLQLGNQSEIRRVAVAFLSAGQYNNEEEIGPILDHEALSDLVALVRDLTGTHGGTFTQVAFDDKGLTLFLIFGAPRAIEHAEQTALRLLFEFRIRLRQQHPDILVRAGLDTGLTYMGLTGGPLRQEWTCLGDCVNMASRLMSAAAWGEIYFSSRLIKSLNSQFLIDELPAMQFKGKELPESVFRLSGFDIRQLGSQYKNRMIGRRKELDLLLQTLINNQTNRKPALVSVLGEPGMGKTRLIEKFRHKVKTETNNRIEWIEFACSENDAGLQPVRAWLEFIFAINPFESPEAKRRKIEQTIAQISSTLPPEAKVRDTLTRAPSFLAALIDCSWPDSPYAELTTPRLRLENQIASLSALVQTLTMETAAVIFVEDGHWLPPTTVSWLCELLRTPVEFPRLILVASRQEEGIEPVQWPVSQQFTHDTLVLGPFSAQDINDLSHELCHALPDESLLQFLESRSAGNPFFVEQILLHLDETDLLKRQYKAGSPVPELHLHAETGRLPARLETLLLARFDRLEAGSREGLKHAATLGIRFFRRILDELLGRSHYFRSDPGNLLTNATFQGIIVNDVSMSENLSGEEAYFFRHALMQKAAYHLQLPAVRTHLHELAAQIIEELFPRTGELLAELAGHWRCAGNFNREADVLEQAISQAQFACRTEEQLACSVRLVDCLQSLGLECSERMIKAIRSKAVAFEIVGRGQEALTLLEQASSLACDRGHHRHLVELLTRTANRLRYLGRLDEAILKAGQAQEMAEQIDYDLGKCLALSALGHIYGRLSDYTKAIELYDESCRLALKINDQSNAATAFGNMATMYFNRGDYTRAEELYRKSLGLCLELKDRRLAALVRGNIGNVHERRGEFQSALECHLASVKELRAIGDRSATNIANMSIGAAYMDLGDNNLALQYLEEALRTARTIGNDAPIMICTGNIGLVRERMGDLDGALTCYQDVLKWSEERGDKYNIALTLDSLSSINNTRGDYLTAAEQARRAIDIFEELQSPPEKVNPLLRLAESLIRQGHCTDSIEIWNQAKSIVDQFKLDHFNADLDRLREMCRPEDHLSL